MRNMIGGASLGFIFNTVLGLWLRSLLKIADKLDHDDAVETRGRE